MNDFPQDFPSDKACEKLTHISVSGNAAELIKWLSNHTEIDLRVPPVFSGFFVIEMLYDGHNVSLCVTYNKDKTVFAFRCSMDKERLLIASVDYNKIGSDRTIVAHQSVRLSASRKYQEKSIDDLTQNSVFLILAVQAYMLYHTPEVIEHTVSSPAHKKGANETKSNNTNKQSTPDVIKIKKSVQKLIRINPSALPPREYKYKKLAWSVRGHYRHVGKDKKVKYIAPFTCNRGESNRKPKTKKYIIEGDK